MRSKVRRFDKRVSVPYYAHGRMSGVYSFWGVRAVLVLYVESDRWRGIAVVSWRVIGSTDSSYLGSGRGLHFESLPAFLFFLFDDFSNAKNLHLIFWKIRLVGLLFVVFPMHFLMHLISRKSHRHR